MSYKVSRTEKVSYAVAGLGQNILYALFSTQLFFFYTEIAKIKPVTVGLIMAVAKIWDAFNDFIMGYIVDNTRTKWGKMRPYLLFTPLPIAVLTILLFTAPEFDYGLKIAYIITTYILWDMAYTACDIPYWGLSAALTDDVQEKNDIISFTRVMTMVGSAIGIIGVPLLIDALGADKRAFFIGATVVSIVGCGLFSLSFFKTKERVTPPKEKIDFIKNFKLLLNKPFLLIMIASFVGFGHNMAEIVGAHFATYNLGDYGYFSILGGLLMGAVIIAISITPLLHRVFQKRTIFVGANLFGVMMYIVMFLVGYEKLWLTCLFLFLSSLSLGFFTVLQTSIIADSVDYVEYKTGQRAEGVSFAGQTFITKLSSALSTFVAGMVLDAFGFVEGANVQTPQALKGIWLLVTIVPAIAFFLATIPMLFYDITKEKQQMYVEEVKLRKEGMVYEKDLV